MNVAVFCASSNLVSEQFKLQVESLGCWIAQNGHTLVYGGATGGLMDVVAKAVRAEGGYIVGIIPQNVVDKGRKSDICDELLCVGSLSERKELLKDYSDVCVVLPGGFGTFDEMFDTIASTMLGYNELQVILVNIDGYYDGILEQIQRMKEEQLGYVRTGNLYVCSSVEECIEVLKQKE